MTGKRKQLRQGIFSVLLATSIFLAGCGQDGGASAERTDGGGASAERTDGGGTGADSGYMQPDSHEESRQAAGEEGGSTEEAGGKDAHPEEENAMESESADGEPSVGSASLEAGAASGEKSGVTSGEKSGADSGEESETASGEGSGIAAAEAEEETQEEYRGSREPKLPTTGTQLSDFVAEGWEIIDSVELDFNGDGIADYVGVQEVPLDKSVDGWQNILSLRVLFAIASDGPGQYRLDFQDANLIRARSEGGMLGDPFGGLEGGGASFTTYADGGSSDRWTESRTYTYREGTWYLTASEDEYGYAWNVDDYQRDDWDSGIRTCKVRGRTVNCTHGECVYDPGVYELEYEMRLDEPLTLYQASRRWWLSAERITDWEVGDIVLAEGIELPKDRIWMPGDAYYEQGSLDEEYAFYRFTDEENEKEYLAGYNWQDKTLTVLAEEDLCISRLYNIDIIGRYGNKVYYSAGIVEDICYKDSWPSSGEESLTEKRDVVGQEVVRMNLDGTEKETIFTYRYPGADQPVLEERPPYIAIGTALISGGEIVLEVYVGDEAHPWYRMNVDGSRLRKIGETSDEFPGEEQ